MRSKGLVRLKGGEKRLHETLVFLHQGRSHCLLQELALPEVSFKNSALLRSENLGVLAALQYASCGTDITELLIVR